MQLPPGIYDPPYRINNENSQVNVAPMQLSGPTHTHAAWIRLASACVADSSGVPVCSVPCCWVQRFARCAALHTWQESC